MKRAERVSAGGAATPNGGGGFCPAWRRGVCIYWKSLVRPLPAVLKAACTTCMPCTPSSRREVNPVLSYLRMRLSSLSKREEGQTMAEYGVVLAVVTIGAVAIFTALSGGITSAVQRVIDLLPS
jgi:Flp pilus assembly pilin Flp